MNRRHVGCCKQGVAEGMLVAIMVVGNRRATQWGFEPVLELGAKLRDWRESSLCQNPQDWQSRKSRPAAGGPDLAQEHLLSGYLLSQDVRPLGKACRDHGYPPQTGPHHFS